MVAGEELHKAPLMMEMIYCKKMRCCSTDQQMRIT